MALGFLVLVRENGGDTKGRHRLGQGSEVRRKEQTVYELSAHKYTPDGRGHHGTTDDQHRCMKH